MTQGSSGMARGRNGVKGYEGQVMTLLYRADDEAEGRPATATDAPYQHVFRTRHWQGHMYRCEDA